MGTLTCHADLYDEAGYNPPICDLSKPVAEKAMPLTVLADRLTLGPPSIGVLIDLLEQSEYVQEFLELVREYLPEHEKEIMLEDHDDRAYRFCQLFSARLAIRSTIPWASLTPTASSTLGSTPFSVKP